MILLINWNFRKYDRHLYDVDIISLHQWVCLTRDGIMYLGCCQCDEAVSFTHDGGTSV